MRRPAGPPRPPPPPPPRRHRATPPPHQGTPSLYPQPARRARCSRHRAARLVTIPIRDRSMFQPGLVHPPVTPFTRDRRIDFDVYEKLIEFHIRNRADCLALAMHVG